MNSNFLRQISRVLIFNIFISGFSPDLLAAVSKSTPASKQVAPALKTGSADTQTAGSDMNTAIKKLTIKQSAPALKTSAPVLKTDITSTQTVASTANTTAKSSSVKTATSVAKQAAPVIKKVAPVVKKQTALKPMLGATAPAPTPDPTDLATLNNEEECNIGLSKSGKGCQLNGLTVADITSSWASITDLTGASLQYAQLQNYSFGPAFGGSGPGTILAGVDFSYANLTGTDFTNTDLTGANFTGATVTDAIFAGANLSGVTMNTADGTTLIDILNDSGTCVGCNLANLKASDITTTSITDLSKANLENANLSNLPFTGTNFTGAILDNAIFTGATFTNTALIDVSIDRTVFDKATFSGTGTLLSVKTANNPSFSSTIFNNCAALVANTMNGAKLDSAKLSGNFAIQNGSNITTSGTMFNDVAVTTTTAAPVFYLVDYTCGNYLPYPDNAPSVTSLLTGLGVATDSGGLVLDGLGMLKATGSCVGCDLSSKSVNNRLQAITTSDIAAASKITNLAYANFASHLNQDGSTTPQADLSGAINLASANLSYANLTNVNLSNANLTGTNFYNATLTNANLDNATLNNTNFQNTNLGGAAINIAGATGSIANTNFKGADIPGTVISSYNMDSVDFTGATFDSCSGLVANTANKLILDGTNLNGNVIISNAISSSAVGTKYNNSPFKLNTYTPASGTVQAILAAFETNSTCSNYSALATAATSINIAMPNNSNLDDIKTLNSTGSCTTQCNLNGLTAADINPGVIVKDLTGASLQNAQLQGVNWPNVILANTDLTNAKFSNATLTNATITNATLASTVFDTANLAGAIISAKTATNLSFKETIFGPCSALAIGTLTGAQIDSAAFNGNIVVGQATNLTGSGITYKNYPATVNTVAPYLYMLDNTCSNYAGFNLILTALGISYTSLSVLADTGSCIGCMLNHTDTTTTAAATPLLPTDLANISTINNLNFAVMSGAKFDATDKLAGTSLIGADLTSASFSSTDLTGTDFTSANLSNAILSDITLNKTKFNDAIMNDATVSLDSATGLISNTAFTGAYLIDALISSYSMSDVDLSNTKFGTCGTIVVAKASGLILDNATLSGNIIVNDITDITSSTTSTTTAGSTAGATSIVPKSSANNTTYNGAAVKLVAYAAGTPSLYETDSACSGNFAAIAQALGISLPVQPSGPTNSTSNSCPTNTPSPLTDDWCYNFSAYRCDLNSGPKGGTNCFTNQDPNSPTSMDASAMTALSQDDFQATGNAIDKYQTVASNLALALNQYANASLIYNSDYLTFESLHNLAYGIQRTACPANGPVTDACLNSTDPLGYTVGYSPLIPVDAQPYFPTSNIYPQGDFQPISLANQPSPSTAAGNLMKGFMKYYYDMAADSSSGMSLSTKCTQTKNVGGLIAMSAAQKSILNNLIGLILYSTLSKPLPKDGLSNYLAAWDVFAGISAGADGNCIVPGVGNANTDTVTYLSNLQQITGMPSFSFPPSGIPDSTYAVLIAIAAADFDSISGQDLYDIINGSGGTLSWDSLATNIPVVSQLNNNEDGTTTKYMLPDIQFFYNSLSAIASTASNNSSLYYSCDRFAGKAIDTGVYYGVNVSPATSKTLSEQFIFDVTGSVNGDTGSNLFSSAVKSYSDLALNYKTGDFYPFVYMSPVNGNNDVVSSMVENSGLQPAAVNDGDTQSLWFSVCANSDVAPSATSSFAMAEGALLAALSNDAAGDSNVSGSIANLQKQVQTSAQLAITQQGMSASAIAVYDSWVNASYTEGSETIDGTTVTYTPFNGGTSVEPLCLQGFDSGFNTKEHVTQLMDLVTMQMAYGSCWYTLSACKNSDYTTIPACPGEACGCCRDSAKEFSSNACWSCIGAEIKSLFSPSGPSGVFQPIMMSLMFLPAIEFIKKHTWDKYKARSAKPEEVKETADEGAANEADQVAVKQSSLAEQSPNIKAGEEMADSPSGDLSGPESELSPVDVPTSDPSATSAEQELEETISTDVQKISSDLESDSTSETDSDISAELEEVEDVASDASADSAEVGEAREAAEEAETEAEAVGDTAAEGEAGQIVEELAEKE